jgi:hypothetical protein
MVWVKGLRAPFSSNSRSSFIHPSTDLKLQVLRLLLEEVPRNNDRVDGYKRSEQASLGASLGVMYRVTVREAAHRLGVTPDAIRQRIKRGTIQHDKGEDGLTYVYLTPSENVSEGPSEGVTEELLRTYEDQIQFLRAELERKDAILMSLTQRIPELEAPPETRESPETASETSGRPPPRRVREEPRETISRPWWRRMF